MLAFLSNFLLFSGYYVLKPVRDALGLELGTQALPSLFLAGMAIIYLASLHHPFKSAVSVLHPVQGRPKPRQ